MNTPYFAYKTLTEEALIYYLRDEQRLNEAYIDKLYTLIRGVMKKDVLPYKDMLPPSALNVLDQIFIRFIDFIILSGIDKLANPGPVYTEEDYTYAAFSCKSTDDIDAFIRHLQSIESLILITGLDIYLGYDEIDFKIQYVINTSTEKIVFEGMDGAGKNTQSTLLAERLNADLVSFPRYDTMTGQLIRTYLTNPNITQRDMSVLENVQLDSVLYAMDRAHWRDNYENVEKRPIVFDRYFTSNMLYQTMNLSDEDMLKYVEWLYHLEIETFKLPKPDHVFCLVIDPEVTMKNIQGRGRVIDKFENYEVQKQIYDNAKRMEKYFDWILVDVMDDNGQMKSKEEIHEMILKYIL